MIQDLFNHLKKVRDYAVSNGLQSISAGIDIKYEAGRRIGVREGMDTMLQALLNFTEEKDGKDKDL
jgi:hypothetical protein